MCFDACVTDLMAKTPGFKEYYLDSILSDTAAYAGTELIRRTVGMANVKDVTTIADEAKRAHAEKVNILCAKDYIMNRTAFKNGAGLHRRCHARRRGCQVTPRKRRRPPWLSKRTL